MPRISVISTAFRPGGIDIFLAGMQDQVFKDFEVILVDRLYERRHDRVMAMAKDFGIDLIHVPEHRRNGKWINFASAWNTGLALARGAAVFLLADWMYAPPGWLEHHCKTLEGHKRYVVGPYIFMRMPELKMKREFDFDGYYESWCKTFMCVDEHEVLKGDILDEMDVFVDGRFDRSWVDRLSNGCETRDVRILNRNSSGPNLNDGWLHIKNDSTYRSILWDINVLDERLERGRGPLDIDLQLRLKHTGVEFYWDLEAAVYYMDPHRICPTLPYGGFYDRLQNRWSWRDGLQYVSDRRVEIELGGSPRAKNKFRIEDLALSLEPWREIASVRKAEDVTDEEYWGHLIWPDSEL